jgi:hypothetical protein
MVALSATISQAYSLGGVVGLACASRGEKFYLGHSHWEERARAMWRAGQRNLYGLPAWQQVDAFSTLLRKVGHNPPDLGTGLSPCRSPPRPDGV